MSETIREKLNRIDHKCLDEDLRFHDLRSLFEATVPRLSPQDKEEIKKVIQNTDDAETIAAVLQAKAMDDKNESLEEKLVDAPQEVIDELLEILENHGFILDSTFEENPGKTMIMGDVHIQVINPDSFIEDSGEINVQDELSKYVTQDLIDEIHELDQKSDCPITWNFGPNKNGQVTGGLDIMKQYVPNEADESLQEGALTGYWCPKCHNKSLQQTLLVVNDKRQKGAPVYECDDCNARFFKGVRDGELHSLPDYVETVRYNMIESLTEAYIEADKEIIDIIKHDNEYGKNYHVKDHKPDFSSIPVGTIIKFKNLNKYHPEVTAALEKLADNSWNYTYDYDNDNSQQVIDDYQAMRKVEEVDSGAFESLQERVSPRVKGYFEPAYSERYSVRAYYDDNYRGLADSFSSDDFDEIRDKAHEYLSNGSYITVNDYETGKFFTLTPDEYFYGFEGEGIQPYMFESLNESTFNRYSENKGWWYFSPNDVEPDSLPKGVHVLETRKEESRRYGVHGTFMLLDAKLSPSQLVHYGINAIHEETPLSTWETPPEGEVNDIYPESLDLLSDEEIEALPYNVRPYQQAWWSRSPNGYINSDHSRVVYVGSNGLIDGYGAEVNTPWGLAVRPALTVSNLDSSDLKLYKQYSLFGARWIYIGDNKFLYHGKPRYSIFNPLSWEGIHDDEYESSEIKRYVDNWLKELQSSVNKIASKKDESLKESVDDTSYALDNAFKYKEPLLIETPPGTAIHKKINAWCAKHGLGVVTYTDTEPVKEVSSNKALIIPEYDRLDDQARFKALSSMDKAGLVVATVSSRSNLDPAERGMFYIVNLRDVNESLEESEDSYFDYDEAVNYIESKGISADPTTYVGEYICDLLDDLADENESYSKFTLDKIIDRVQREFDFNITGLNEDTIKQNGKWVNKGKEGTHGKFRTKKQADAQRKAMFANGYSEQLTEALEAPYFKAFITNLGKYNEGELVGDWVEFPIDEDDFTQVLESIGIGDTDDFGAPYEEWFVSDYECNLPGFDWQELGEYPSYESLQEYGELVNSIDDLEAVSNALEVTGNLQDAIDGLENGNIIFYRGVDNNSDLGYMWVDEVYGGAENLDKETLERYFDYEQLGRDLSFDSYENDEGEDISAGEYWCGDENASDAEIGEAFVDEVGIDGVSDISSYFDYEQFGRDLSFGDFTFTSDGCVLQESLKKNGKLLKEDYQHKDDEWGNPYTYKEVERELKSITNDFTDEDGNIRCYWEQEKEYGKQILKDYYEIVEVSDGRTGSGEDMSWVISYARPKEN